MGETSINTIVTIISIIVGIVGIALAVISSYQKKNATTIQSLRSLGKNVHINNLTIITTKDKKYIAPIVEEKSSAPQYSNFSNTSAQKIKAALKFENSILIYQTKDSSFRFCIRSQSHEVLAVSEPYQTDEDCRKAVIRFVDECR